MAESQTFYLSYAPALEVLQHRGKNNWHSDLGEINFYNVCAANSIIEGFYFLLTLQL